MLILSISVGVFSVLKGGGGRKNKTHKGKIKN